ncbi:MAG: glycoside hydrolase family 1 protein [Candidatus Amesbacteria bacterium]|nr:glycoside hydrolase family 1 protein [Candidatus Amesbacteria bacterium]
MKKFPKDFLWGTATAAHQVEGNNVHNDWWRWEHEVVGRLKSGIASDHYQRFKSDFSLAADMKHGIHRFSVEWSRLEPTMGQYNQVEIDHYREVLAELKKHNIKSMVTLWHFTLPTWFADLGGFESKSNFNYFYRFVELCAREFGGLVDYWIVINEPNHYVVKSYLMGMWPPQKRNFFTALAITRNLATIHCDAYKLLHKIIPDCQVSSAHQLINYFPKNRWNPVDIFLSKLLSFLANDLFIILTKGHHDFFGLNYYYKFATSLQNLIRHITQVEVVKTMEDLGQDLGWIMDSKSMYWAINKIWRTVGRPIIITENGIADASDILRQNHLIDHLKWVQKAIIDGIDVRGYLHWSLIDNFEWQSGFIPRFGLVEVDFDTQVRTPRPSCSIYTKIITEGL